MPSLPMRAATVHVEATVQDDASVVRLVFEDLVGPQGGARNDVYWRVPDAADLPTPAILDSLVCPLALHAQAHGQDLRVRGPMSAMGLFNLGQLLEARQGTSPALYPRVIAVEPDSVVTRAIAPDAAARAVLAFSGGLDSTFSAARHALGLRGEASFVLDGLVMVHGLDAPLSDRAGFAGMRERAMPVSRRLGVPIRAVETDSMRLSHPAAGHGALWPQQATPLIAAAMSLFMHRAATGIMGGGIPYGAGRVGLGHPPILDQFAAHALFRIATDGAELSRADKIEALLPFPDLLAGIKVCVGSMNGGGNSALNCGRCWKCLVTYVNFRCLGITAPPCFAEPVDEALISTLSMPSVYMARDLALGYEDIVTRGATGAWADRMARVMAKVPPEPYFPREIGKLIRPLFSQRLRAAIRARLPATLRP